MLLERFGVKVERATQRIGAALANTTMRRSARHSCRCAADRTDARGLRPGPGAACEHLHAYYRPDRYSSEIDLYSRSITPRRAGRRCPHQVQIHCLNRIRSRKRKTAGRLTSHKLRDVETIERLQQPCIYHNLPRSTLAAAASGTLAMPGVLRAQGEERQGRHSAPGKPARYRIPASRASIGARHRHRRPSTRPAASRPRRRQDRNGARRRAVDAGRRQCRSREDELGRTSPLRSSAAIAVVDLPRGQPGGGALRPAVTSSMSASPTIIVTRGLKNTFRFGPGFGVIAKTAIDNLVLINEEAGKPAKTVDDRARGLGCSARASPSC